MKQIALLALGLLATLGVEAQTYKFDFTTGKKTKDGYTKITPADRYSEEKGYGYMSRRFEAKISAALLPFALISIAPVKLPNKASISVPVPCVAKSIITTVPAHKISS